MLAKCKGQALPWRLLTKSSQDHPIQPSVKQIATCGCCNLMVATIKHQSILMCLSPMSPKLHSTMVVSQCERVDGCVGNGQSLKSKETLWGHTSHNPLILEVEPTSDTLGLHPKVLSNDYSHKLWNIMNHPQIIPMIQQGVVIVQNLR
jgi:hypothetical protein